MYIKVILPARSNFVSRGAASLEKDPQWHTRPRSLSFVRDRYYACKTLYWEDRYLAGYPATYLPYAGKGCGGGHTQERVVGETIL